VRTAATGRSRNAARYSGKGRDWETPPDLFKILDDEFHFTLDPCCTDQTAKCALYFTEELDGLTADWGDERVFMNPPYGRELPAWTRKAREAAAAGALVVGLLPASVDLAWFHDDVLAVGAEVRFLRGRPKFLSPGGGSQARSWVQAFAASLIVIWYPFKTV
jgi:phage N-6-adenine-methyltransferase